jgi:hypothetical protein
MKVNLNSRIEVQPGIKILHILLKYLKYIVNHLLYSKMSLH